MHHQQIEDGCRAQSCRIEGEMTTKRDPMWQLKAKKKTWTKQSGKHNNKDNNEWVNSACTPRTLPPTKKTSQGGEMMPTKMRDNLAEDTRTPHTVLNVKQPQGQKRGKCWTVVCLRVDTLRWWGLWRVPPLFSCFFPFFFHSTSICSFYTFVLRHHLSPLSVPCNAADGLCERCGRSQRISICVTQRRPSFPLTAWCSTCKSPRHSSPSFSIKIYCWCVAGPGLCPGAPVLPSWLQASVYNKPGFAFV